MPRINLFEILSTLAPYSGLEVNFLEKTNGSYYSFFNSFNFQNLKARI